MDGGRKEKERKVKSFAKPLALPGCRSWMEKCGCICGEWVAHSACCSLQPGFESWAVSSWEEGSLPLGTRELWLSTVLTKVNKQLPASPEPGLSTFFFFLFPLEKLCGELQNKENKQKLGKKLIWQSCRAMTKFLWNLWRPRWLQSQPLFIQAGAAMVVLQLCMGSGFYWGTLAAFGA